MTFALRIMTLVDALPRTVAGQAIGRQIIRSGTSVGANYRSAQRARTKREFTSKLGIALEEADETSYWLDLLVKSDTMPASRITDLADECEQLVAILSRSVQQAKRKGATQRA